MAYEEETNFVGYITLIAAQIEAEREIKDPIEDDGVRFPYDKLPCVKIARLAIDKKYRGKGLGTEFVKFAQGVVKDKIMPFVGCRFLVVDSKQASVDFYLKLKFRLLNTKENRESSEPLMFIDMSKVKIDV